MRRLIPPRTKRISTLYKDFNYKDLVICVICILIAAVAVSSNLGWIKWVIVIVSLLTAMILCLQYGYYYRGYDWLVIIRNYVLSKRKYTSEEISKMLNYSDTEEKLELAGISFSILELYPIEFVLFSRQKQENIIKQFAMALREIDSGSIVKIEKPIDYSYYIQRYKDLIKETTIQKDKFISDARERAVRQHKAFNLDNLDLTTYNARIEILEKNIVFLDYVNNRKKINAEVYYLAIYESNNEKLKSTVNGTINRLENLGITVRKVANNEIPNILQYVIYKTSLIENSSFTYPNIEIKRTHLKINDEEWCIANIGKYPVFAEGNHWSSNLFNISNTNVVINFSNANKEKIIKSVNKSIKEIRYRYTTEKDASGQQDLQIQLESLQTLLKQFQLGNEGIHSVNFYIMYQKTQEEKIRQVFQSQGFVLNRLHYMQFEAFVSMLPICGIEMLPLSARHIQSTTLAAAFPFINNLFMDKDGNYLGDFRYPIFWDMWIRNKNRLNSNISIIGQSGSGKTYLQKKLLMQQRCQGTRIFVLDCEHEYYYMANKLGGQNIEMSGGSRINPFQIYPISDADDVMLQDSSNHISGDVSSQCSFLSEWFKSIINMDINCKAKLDNCISEMYQKAGIEDYSDISKLKAKDFPTFDTLIKLIIEKKKSKNVTPYEYDILQKLENYMSLFIGNGIYARLWNGATTLDIKNDFIIFDFQQLFANANTEVCNAQMMLLMRLLMREVIKTKNNNDNTGASNRTIVLVDEAHRYISSQFPIALDTLENFARRIRKYQGSLIVATQNIKDFIGTTESTMRTKATAVINNCQYSMLFGLKPDDLNDVRQLYAKYGDGLTDEELNFLGSAELGQMLFLVESEKRSVVQVGLIDGEKSYIERT